MLEDITRLIDEDSVKSLVPDGRPLITHANVGFGDQLERYQQIKETIEELYQNVKPKSVAYSIGDYEFTKSLPSPDEVRFPVQFFKSYKLKTKKGKAK